MLGKKQLQSILISCSKDIKALPTPKGAEQIVQESLANFFREESKKVELEVPLKQIGGKQTWASENGRLDLLVKNHGIELKVICMSGVGHTASNALYDIGQISSDYWRLQNARGLKSGELVILLMGALVQCYEKPVQALREFHNRMFVDFSTSMYHGELADQAQQLNRSRQIASIFQMGFNKPYHDRLGKTLVLHDGLGLLSIPIINS